MIHMLYIGSAWEVLCSCAVFAVEVGLLKGSFIGRAIAGKASVCIPLEMFVTVATLNSEHLSRERS